MHPRIPGMRRPAAHRPTRVGPGRERKVGIIGTQADTRIYAPWDDPSWEFWAHTSAWNVIPEGRADVVVDTHPPHCFREGKKNGFADYYAFLKQLRTPIYMDERYPEIPASMRFPREKIKQQFPYEFGSLTAQMIALLLCEGVTHIGLWGVEYHDIEYLSQRCGTVFWVGIAIGRGVQIVLPPSSTILKNVMVLVPPGTKVSSELVGDYPFDTHSTPEKYEKLKEIYLAYRNAKFDAKALKPILTAEDALDAACKRMTDPKYLEQISQLTKDDDIPEALLQKEARQRDAAMRRAQAATAPTEAGLGQGGTE